MAYMRWMIGSLSKHFHQLPMAAFYTDAIWGEWAAKASFRHSSTSTIQALLTAPAPPADLDDRARNVVLTRFGDTYGSALLAGWSSDPAVWDSAIASPKKTIVRALATNPSLTLPYVIEIVDEFVRYAPPASISRPGILEWFIDNPSQLTLWLKHHSYEDVIEFFAANHRNVHVLELALDGASDPAWSHKRPTTASRRKATYYAPATAFYTLFDLADSEVRRMYLSKGFAEQLGSELRRSSTNSMCVIQAVEESREYPIDDEGVSPTYHLIQGFTQGSLRRTLALHTNNRLKESPAWNVPLFKAALDIDFPYPKDYIPDALGAMEPTEALRYVDVSDADQVLALLPHADSRNYETALALFEKGLGQPVPDFERREDPTAPRDTLLYGITQHVLEDTLRMLADAGRLTDAVHLLEVACAAPAFPAPAKRPASRYRRRGTQYKYKDADLTEFVCTLRRVFIPEGEVYLPAEFDPLVDVFKEPLLAQLLFDRFTPVDLVERFDLTNVPKRVRIDEHTLWNHPQVHDLLRVLFPVGTRSSHRFARALDIFSSDEGLDTDALDVLLSFEHLGDLIPPNSYGPSSMPNLTNDQLWKLVELGPLTGSTEASTSDSRYLRSLVCLAVSALLSRDVAISASDLLDIVERSPFLTSIDDLPRSVHPILVQDFIDRLGGSANRWEEAMPILTSGWQGSYEELLLFVSLASPDEPDIHDVTS